MPTTTSTDGVVVTLPNYKILKYEINFTNEMEYDIFKGLSKRFEGNLAILYKWFESLTTEQLVGIHISVDTDFDNDSNAPNVRDVGFFFKHGTSAVYVVHRETYRGRQTYYSHWRFR